MIAPASPGPARRSPDQRGRLDHAALDLLATLVAVVKPEGECVFANSVARDRARPVARASSRAASSSTGSARRQALRETIAAVSATPSRRSRFEALAEAPVGGAGDIAAGARDRQPDRRLGGSVVFEMVEIEQQNAPGARGARARAGRRSTKELIRNLAHEIKNPLGGIRGAAQLLEMEIESRRADRVHAGHHQRGRPAAVAGRPAARAAPQAARRRRRQHPRGAASACARWSWPNSRAAWSIERDYDTSIPEFRGDREQLIQAVLNIAHNAAQALAEQIERGGARIIAAHARRAPGDARQAALSSGTGIAYPGQRPGRPRVHCASRSSIRWCRGAKAARASA